jgi:two-component system, cell cycle sensor histidine kinase and response regulator CckA
VRPNMRVLFMSGYSENAITKDGALSNGLSYIAKPFAPEALAQKVRTLLGESNHRERAVLSAY